MFNHLVGDASLLLSVDLFDLSEKHSITQTKKIGKTYSTRVRNTNVVLAAQVIGDGADVVVRRLTAVVSLLDNINDTVTSIASTLSLGDGPERLIVRVVVLRHGTGVGLVHEVRHGSEIDLPVNESGLFGDELEDVGTAVPAAEGGETPVSAEGGNDGVVGVEGVVSGALEMLGDGTTEEDAVDAVLLGVVASLVEGDEDQSVLVEVLVLEERGEEVGEEVSTDLDISVVAVVGHV